MQTNLNERFGLQIQFNMKNLRCRPPLLATKACLGSPCAGEVQERQGIPASPHCYSYSASFLLFQPQFIRFLAHYSSLEKEAAGLRVHCPCRCVYRSDLWLATTLPCLPSFTRGELQAASHDSRRAIVCGVRCLQFPQCSFVFSSNESISVRFLVFPPFI